MHGTEEDEAGSWLAAVEREKGEEGREAILSFTRRRGKGVGMYQRRWGTRRQREIRARRAGDGKDGAGKEVGGKGRARVYIDRLAHCRARAAGLQWTRALAPTCSSGRLLAHRTSAGRGSLLETRWNMDGAAWAPRADHHIGFYHHPPSRRLFHLPFSLPRVAGPTPLSPSLYTEPCKPRARGRAGGVARGQRFRPVGAPIPRHRNGLKRTRPAAARGREPARKRGEGAVRRRRRVLSWQALSGPPRRVKAGGKGICGPGALPVDTVRSLINRLGLAIVCKDQCLGLAIRESMDPQTKNPCKNSEKKRLA